MAVTMVIGNDPKIKASLFAPGYSIAAVIANEFTEATGELYTSALIELGLVLFALTIVINGVARLLVIGADKYKDAEMTNLHTLRRKTVNAVMLTLTGLVHVVRRRHAGLHPGVSVRARRDQPELEFLHQAADAGGRNRRRHGQRHRGQRQASPAGHRYSAFRSDSWAAFIWRNSAATHSPSSSATSRTC